MKSKLVAIGLITILYATGMFAQEEQAEIDQKDVDEQNKLSAPVEVVLSSTMVEEWRDRVKKEFGLTNFSQQDGKFFAFGSAPVLFKDTDPQYGDALAVAFDAAMMKAQEYMVMQIFGRGITEKARELFQDASTNAKEIPIEPDDAGVSLSTSKALRILDKALSVVEGKLDNELKELGVDEQEYRTAPVEKKKLLYKNAFVKETGKKASGEISGLFPIQTAVLKDKSGNTHVAVICIKSDKTVQIAKDISLKRRSLIKGRGVDIAATMIPNKTENWIGQLGTRLVYDLDGTPAIVSYGLGSYVPDGDDDFLNDSLREEARQQAIDNADSQIAEVVNGYLSAETKLIQGQSMDKTVSRQMVPDALHVENMIKNIIKETQNFAKSRASMDLAGIAGIADKYIKLPTGQEICVAVRVWKYSTLDAINQMNRPRGARPGVSGVDKGSGQEGRFEGFKVNDLDDF